MVEIPARYLRNEACHRSFSPRRNGGGHYEDIGCGFICGGRSGRDILFRTYGALYVLRGTGIYIDWEGREHALYPGCVAQRLPAKLHSTLYDNPAEWVECWIIMSTSLYLPMAEMGIIDADRPVLYPGLDLSFVERFDTLLADMKAARDAELPPLLPRMLSIITTFHALDRQGGADTRDERMVAAAQAVLARDLEKPLALGALAAGFHLSYERFRKIFTQQTGCPPGLFRVRKRIEAACALLAGERPAVKEVAARLGYPDAFSFSRQFRKVVGVSPAHFRDSR